MVNRIFGQSYFLFLCVLDCCVLLLLAFRVVWRSDHGDCEAAGSVYTNASGQCLLNAPRGPMAATTQQSTVGGNGVPRRGSAPHGRKRAQQERSDGMDPSYSYIKGNHMLEPNYKLPIRARHQSLKNGHVSSCGQKASIKSQNNNNPPWRRSAPT